MDVNFWMKRFLKSVGTLIEEDGEETMPTTMCPVAVDDFNSYLSPYVGEKAILALLLDYDGTLAPIARHPDLAVLPPETKKVLERLANRPDIFIAIISGRNVENVKEMVGIEGITYAGNHGLEIHHSDGTRFMHSLPDKAKIGDLKKSLEEECCQEGAWVEDKGQVLTYHYRNVPREKRPPLTDKAKKLITDAGYKVLKWNHNHIMTTENCCFLSDWILPLRFGMQATGFLGQGQGFDLHFENRFWSRLD